MKKMIGMSVAMVGVIVILSAEVFAWGLPVKIGGGAQVDAKGLTDRSNQLMDSVATATEKLGLALADVYTMTGKNEEAIRLRQEMEELKTMTDRKLRSKSMISTLDGSFNSMGKDGLKDVLKQVGKAMISQVPIGSAVLNITEAVKCDKDAVDQAKALAEELKNAVKSASGNPALAMSLTDLKSALDAVLLIIDSVPRQVDHATRLGTELREFAQAHGIAL